MPRRASSGKIARHAAAPARRRTRRKKRGGLFTRREFLGGALLAGGAAAGAAVLRGCDAGPLLPEAPTKPSATPNPALPAREIRAVWVSYLDLAEMDFGSEAAFARQAAQLMENCAALGLNTVLAQVRPFGDALYRSSLYPWSHLCTGTQGRDPGFDPLDILIREAHARGLSLEAWVNPYRLRLTETLPRTLAAENLANTHPEWVVEVGTGLYLNPAVPEAAAYVVRGVEELVQNYAVDGIHFDDYFYPTTEEFIDAAQFAASGAAELGAWRRANVTALVKRVHDAVKAEDPTLRFGISPQGNRDNNYYEQYSDVGAWMTAEGEEAVVDYICPQLYWGRHFMLSNGSWRYAFDNILAEWCSLPRSAGVALLAGLGAYRIGVGDGSADEQSLAEWRSGGALAAQVEALRAQGVAGYALFRYGSLWGAENPELAQWEREGLAAQNN